MGSQEVQVFEPGLDPQVVWLAHVRQAVNKFLKTAVVIDNQPYITSSSASVGMAQVSGDESGLGDDVKTLDPPPQSVSGPGAHDLDLRKVSDVFAENGIACAFVLPEDADTNNDAKKKRALCAAQVSDLVVIDWYLSDKDESLTLQILQEIAKSDHEENGRLRLICIYTGQPRNKGMFEDIKASLAAGGLALADVEGVEFCASNNSALVVLLNKGEVSPENLPGELIGLFSRLADGLIPAFALAAIGAIRRNTHHMLTRFSSSLDSAYISNRLITNPPGDVAELIRELLVAECDNALGLDSVADDYLEPKVVSNWLDVNGVRATSYSVNGGDIQLNREAIDGLLQYGINDSGFKLSSGGDKVFPEKFRSKISKMLVDDDAEAYASENEFARLVAFRREAFGSSTIMLGENWKPSLTTGTLLRVTVKGCIKYLLCFTPACDTLRLKKARPFVFLEGERSLKPYDLVVREQNGDSISLYFDKTYPKVVTYSFIPDKDTQRVRGEKVIVEGEPTRYFFKPELEPAGEPEPTGVIVDVAEPKAADEVEFLWLGEMRYGRAMSEMTNLANRWMRVGVLDSEYLRLASKKHFNFSS